MNFLKSTSSRNLPVRSRLGDYNLLKSFDDFFNRTDEDFYDSSTSQFSPVVNIEETKDSYIVEAEVPGVKKEDIEVKIKDDYLVIEGEKKSLNEDKRDQYRRIERSNGSFYRTITLPNDIDKEKIHAELKDGVLSVEIKKSEVREVSAKRINIQ